MAEATELSDTALRNFLAGKSASHRIIYLVLEALNLPSDDDSLFDKTNEAEGIKVSNSAGSVFTGRIINPTAISETPVDDVQGNAANQISILASYYSEGLTQAKASFRSALIISGIGFFFFLTAVIFVLNRQPRDRTLIPLVSGAVLEVVAGINFYLYGQATKQLATFQNKLDQMQRFLLANSICESLEGDSKQAARAKLVETVSSLIE